MKPKTRAISIPEGQRTPEVLRLLYPGLIVAFRENIARRICHVLAVHKHAGVVRTIMERAYPEGEIDWELCLPSEGPTDEG